MLVGRIVRFAKPDLSLLAAYRRQQSRVAFSRLGDALRKGITDPVDRDEAVRCIPGVEAADAWDRIEGVQRTSRGIEDAVPGTRNELGGQLVCHAKTRRKVVPILLPLSAVVSGGEFESTSNGEPGLIANRVRNVGVEPGHAVEALGRRTLDLIAQTGVDGEPIGHR